jgi:hypothetical protein
LEELGTPTVVVTTTQFVGLTTRVAASFGLAECRVVVVEHPLGGTDAQTILARADGLVEAIVTSLSRR